MVGAPVSSAAGASTPPTLIVGAPLHATVPTGFVGLAFEAQHLGDAVDDPAVSNLPSFLSQLGAGSIRFAGSSADESTLFEKQGSNPLPRWAKRAITPVSLTTVGSLAAVLGSTWKVDLAVNLYHLDPTRAAAEVAAARSALGSSLGEVSIGNEPELYTYMYPRPVSYPQYLAGWSATRRAIAARVPQVPIGGPDFYLRSWFSLYTSSARAGLGSLGTFDQHFYPFSDCARHGVTVAQLLGNDAINREDAMIRDSRAMASLAGIPTSFDEFNSVSCGSSAPVQHEQASALWGVHALLEAARRGIATVDVQTNLENCASYTPLCLANASDPSSVTPHPLWRAMQLVAGLEGATFRQLDGALPVGVSAYALSNGASTSIVVTNGTATDLTGLAIGGLGAVHVASIETMGTGDVTSSSDPGLTSTPSSGDPTGLVAAAGTTSVFVLSP